jgi:hypothetical protein
MAKTMILAFAFGAPYNVGPNRLIARRVLNLYRISKNADIFT